MKHSRHMERNIVLGPHEPTSRAKCLSCKNMAANVGPIKGTFKSGNARENKRPHYYYLLERMCGKRTRMGEGGVGRESDL